MKNPKSWNHVAHRLLPAEVDHADRFGHGCAIGKCVTPPTHALRWTYVTGGFGRSTIRRQRVCTEHAKKFAAKHNIVIGPEQAEPQSASTAALTSMRTRRVRRVRVYLTGGHRWYLDKHHDGSTNPTSQWMPGITGDADLPAAIEEAQQTLADQHLVPDGAWQTPDASQARVTVVDAHRHDDWVAVPWNLSVTCNPEGMWQLRRCLGVDVFPPVVTDLGNTRMTLDRAVGVAVDVLAAQRWVTDPMWTICADTAAADNVGWHPDQVDPAAWREPVG